MFTCPPCSLRRKYQAGVMLAGTSQIYLKPKSHSRSYRTKPRRSIHPLTVFQLFELHSHVATTAHRYRFSPLVFTLISGVRSDVFLSNTRVFLMTPVYCSSSEFTLSGTRWSRDADCQGRPAMASIILSTCNTCRHTN